MHNDPIPIALANLSFGDCSKIVTPFWINGEFNSTLHYDLHYLSKTLNYEEPHTYDNQKELTVGDYIEKRYKKQLDWYEKHAVQARVTYYTLQILIVLAGALIPIINVFPSSVDNNIYTI